MNTRTEGGPHARVALMSDLSTQIEGLADKSLLLLDDDTALRTRLGRALEGRGFEPVLASSVTEALAAVKVYPPAFAVLDMRLEDGTGLKVVEAVREARPDAKIIMLTGYGNIATAVAAVKAGAVSQVPGQVHDSSASGSTLFVEPRSVLTMGNKLVELESRIRDEERKVLAELSALVAEEASALKAICVSSCHDGVAVQENTTNTSVSMVI